MGLAGELARRMVYDADVPEDRCPSTRMVRFRGARERNTVYILDHRQEPDLEHGDL